MTNPAKRTSLAPEVRRVIQELRALYVPTPEFKLLKQQLWELLEQRRADDADGVVPRTRGIVLVGASGSGKTTALEQLARNFSQQMQTDEAQEFCEYIYWKVANSDTTKAMGMEILRAAGYGFGDMSPSKTVPAIFHQVKVNFKLRGTKFLGIDEAQDLVRHQTDKERQVIVTNLKSLMENSVWPVGLVLAGTPNLKPIINQDVQLARRLRPIEISSLHAIRDVGRVIKIMRAYTDRARIEAAPSISSEEFALRLIHAADYQVGLVTEIVVAALIKALSADGFDARLEVAHFTRVYRERNCVSSYLNPFVAEEYTRIDTRRLFDGRQEDGGKQ